ncbi:MAG: hypothetical protein ACTICW_06435, partial [Lacticaseibacillus paracasei]
RLPFREEFPKQSIGVLVCTRTQAQALGLPKGTVLADDVEDGVLSKDGKTLTTQTAAFLKVSQMRDTGRMFIRA